MASAFVHTAGVATETVTSTGTGVKNTATAGGKAVTGAVGGLLGTAAGVASGTSVSADVDADVKVEGSAK